MTKMVKHMGLGLAELKAMDIKEFFLMVVNFEKMVTNG